MKKIKRTIWVALVLILALIAAGPWLLYFAGLWNISGRPALPAQLLPVEEAALIWDELREIGPVQVKRIGPWDYALEFAAAVPMKGIPGARAAWLVAQGWNTDHLASRRMSHWHLSGAAMTIWVSRNWTTEQILAKVKEIRSRKKKDT